MLLSPDGQEVTRSSAYPVHAPVSGWAESDPSDWLTAIRDALQDLNVAASVAGLPDVSHVDAIGISGQMHGTVLARWKTGRWPEAVYPAILWADGRSIDQLKHYQHISSDRRKRLGNLPATGMMGPSLAWAAEHKSSILTDAEVAVFPKDFVRAALTGQWATDPSDASGGLLYDFETRDWAFEIADALGVPLRLLPPIRPSSDCAGVVTTVAAQFFGLPAGVPVAVGAGDTPAAMYGTQLQDTDTIQLSVGTAAQAARPITSGETLSLSSVNIFEGITPGLRYRVAAMLNGGLALEWVRERLGFSWDSLYQNLYDLVDTDPKDLIFLPYLAGERTPYMNPLARGAWVGLSLHHSSIDLARAALLGVACAVRLGVETLGTAKDKDPTVRLVGGSARHEPWRRMLAMILEHPIGYSTYLDSSARGAAYLAAEMIDLPLPPGPSFHYQDSPEPAWVGRYYQAFLDRYTALNPGNTTSVP